MAPDEFRDHFSTLSPFELPLRIIAAAEPNNDKKRNMENRTRAWRRHKNRIKKGRGMGSALTWKPEKNWKFLYLRSEKLARAQQLGIEYPRKGMRQMLDVLTDEHPHQN